jgi:hypothetical protein
MARFGWEKGHESSKYVMTGLTGSYVYMAPEVTRSEPYSEKVCSRFFQCNEVAWVS